MDIPRVYVLAYSKNEIPSAKVMPQKQIRVASRKRLEMLVGLLGDSYELVFFNSIKGGPKHWVGLWKEKPVSAKNALKHLSE